jgi:glycosyltransferase involved in cell wall biosynthesis
MIFFKQNKFKEPTQKEVIDTKVTVLMSMYNAEKYVAEAIESILTQTHTNFDFLVIDDGSTDKSKTIALKYARKDKRIILVENESNLGLIESLNKGIQLCKTELIARMDADDWSLPERLEKQIKYLLSHPKVGVLGTNYITYVEKTGKKVKGHVQTNRNIINLIAYYAAPLMHASIMYKRSILIKVGGYNKKYTHTEDYELLLRLLPKYQLANISDRLYMRRWNDTSVSVVYADIQRRNHFRVRKKNYLKGIYLSKGKNIWGSILFRLFKIDYIAMVEKKLAYKKTKSKNY